MDSKTEKFYIKSYTVLPLKFLKYIVIAFKNSDLPPAVNLIISVATDLMRKILPKVQ